MLRLFIAFPFLLASVTAQSFESWQPPCPEASDPTSNNFIMVSGDIKSGRVITKESTFYMPVLTKEDIAEIRSFSNQLEFEGIKLILLPVPYQAIVYLNKSSQIPMKYDAEDAVLNYTNWINDLKKAGINTINLHNLAINLESSGSSFFAKRDHHWTADAIIASSQEVKRVVDFLKIDIDQDYTSEILLERKLGGGSYNNLISQICKTNSNEEYRSFISLSVDKKEDLFTDIGEETIVIGDSYAIPYFGLPQAISHYLSTPVISYAVNGGGPNSGYLDYFSKLDPIKKPKLIIWSAKALQFKSSDIREYSAVLRAALHSDKVMSTSEGLIGENPLEIKIPELNNDKSYIEIKSSGIKTERLDTEIYYTDGTKERKIFIKRQDAPQSVYEVKYFLNLPEGKQLSKVLIQGPNGAKISIRVYSF